MRVEAVFIDLPEASDALLQPAEAEPRQETPETVVDLDVTFERKFSARAQANRHVRLAYTGKAACKTIREARRNQFITHLGGAGVDGVKAVIAHRISPLLS